MMTREILLGRSKHLKRIFKSLCKARDYLANHVFFPIHTDRKMCLSRVKCLTVWSVLCEREKSIFFNLKLINQFSSRFSIITANNTINAGSFPIHFIKSINIFWLNWAPRNRSLSSDLLRDIYLMFYFVDEKQNREKWEHNKRAPDS